MRSIHRHRGPMSLPAACRLACHFAVLPCRFAVLPCRFAVLPCRFAVLTAAAVTMAGAGTPVAFAQGGAALLAPPLEQAGKPVTAGNPAAMANVPGAQMAANFAAGGGAPPPAAAAAAAAESSGPVGGQLKYMPSYAVAVLAAGLGLFMICRGSGRRRDSV